MKKILALVIVLFLVPLTTSAQDFCEGNFDYDNNQDGSDAFIFKTDFGRSIISNPCPLDGPAPIPQTGQALNFWGKDDGFYECGVKPIDQRFTNNCDGTFSDHLTGLMWFNTYAVGFLNFTWIDAMLVIDDYNTNEFAGYNDWRMPNIKELQSLVDYGQYAPAMADNLNPYWEGETVWSSTTQSNDWHYKYAVDFYDGTTVLAHYEGINRVLPVRGGHCVEPQPKIACNSAINCGMGGWFNCCCIFGDNANSYCFPDEAADICILRGGMPDCTACPTN